MSGPGPWVVIIGGVVAIAGGVLTLRWAAAIGSPAPHTQEGADEPTPSEEPGP